MRDKVVPSKGNAEGSELEGVHVGTGLPLGAYGKVLLKQELVKATKDHGKLGRRRWPPQEVALSF